jgi:hypothetical protein
MLIYLIMLKTVAFFALAELAQEHRHPGYCAFFYVLIVMLAFSVHYTPAALLFGTLYYTVLALPLFYHLVALREYPFQRYLLTLFGWLALAVLPVFLTRNMLEWEFTRIIELLYLQAIQLVRLITPS